jgi:CBS domain-containing protein
MQSNADKFLNIFNAVERYLQIHFNGGNFGPFRFLLKRAVSKDAVLRQYQDKLYTFGDLRNVLVHNDRFEGKTIAEPLDDIIEEFEQLWELIQHPEKVNIFERKTYYCFMDDKLDKALQILKKYKITQIPILSEGEIVDVLNGNHITIWLANQENPAPGETTISSVFLQAEYRKNFKLIPRNLSVYDAAEMYRNSYRTEPKNRYYDAMIITQHGKPSEKMTGIIVLKDIAKYMSG